MLTGPEVQLTPVEIGVVQGRLNDNAEKERQKKLGGKSAALILALLFVRTLICYSIVDRITCEGTLLLISIQPEI